MEAALCPSPVLAVSQCVRQCFMQEGPFLSAIFLLFSDVHHCSSQLLVVLCMSFFRKVSPAELASVFMAGFVPFPLPCAMAEYGTWP